MWKLIATACFACSAAAAPAATFEAFYDFEMPNGFGEFTSNGITIQGNDFGGGTVTAFYKTLLPSNLAVTRLEFDADMATGWFGHARAFPLFDPANALSGDFVAGHNVIVPTRGLSSFYFGTFGIARLDNLTLTLSTVPEPATWAMMIGGLGLIGARLRQRRARVSIGLSEAAPA